MAEKLLISELYPIVGRQFLPTIAVNSHTFKNPNHSNKSRWFISVFIDEDREFHWATFDTDTMTNLVAFYDDKFTRYLEETNHTKRVQFLDIIWAEIIEEYMKKEKDEKEE